MLALSAPAAIPSSAPAEGVKELQRLEEQKQPGLLQIHPGETVAAFLARLEKAAAAGDAHAQTTLGVLYQEGYGVKQDLAQAAAWFEKAVAGHHLQAQTFLGDLYRTGRGVPVDHPKAFALYLHAAEGGEPVAQFYIGLAYAHGKEVPQDLAEAAKWYARADAHGQIQATNNLGDMYLSGQGVPTDLPKAEKLFRKAAAGGLASGKFGLSLALLGQGKKAEGAEWMRAAAEMGLAAAYRPWAEMLQRGDGVPTDWWEALQWAQKSAREGNVEAGLLAAALFLDHPTAKEAVRRETFEWSQRGAAHGLTRGYFLLGCCLQRGIGTLVDLLAALAQFRSAAKLQMPAAEASVATLREQDLKDLPRDYAEAAKWYRRAAEHGYAGAQYRYGVFLRDGSGVTADLPEALKWLRLAVQKEPKNTRWQEDLAVAERLQARQPELDVEHEFNLGVVTGRMAEKGQPELWTEAAQHFQRAADAGHTIAKIDLAHLYRTGQGVARDDAKAEALIYSLQDTTAPALLYRLGMSYLIDSMRMSPDHLWRAYYFLERAATQGLAPAQNSIGFMLMAGQIPVKPIQALKWLTLAAEAGVPQAKVNLAELRKHMNSQDIAEGERLAAEFHPVPEKPVQK